MTSLIFSSDLPYYEEIKMISNQLTIRYEEKPDGIYVEKKMDMKFRIEFINKVSELAFDQKELGKKMLELYEILGMHDQNKQNLKEIIDGIIKPGASFAVVQLDKLGNSELSDIIEILNLSLKNTDDLIVVDLAIEVNDLLKKMDKNKLVRMGIFQLMKGETNDQTIQNMNQFKSIYGLELYDILD